jgi:protein TonB
VTLPDAQPYYQYNPKPVYPERSHRLREEGKVVLRVWVGVDGLPTKAEVANSSGYERLNAVALRTVMGWRFTPGKRNGQAQAMEVLVPMSFRLEGP